MMAFHIEQEPDRLPGRRVAAVAAAVILFSALCVGIAGALLGLWGPTERRVLAPMPAVIGGMETQLFDLHSPPDRPWEGDSERLRRYGWVDRDRGRVHIPIDVAIDLWLERRSEGAGGKEAR